MPEAEGTDGHFGVWEGMVGILPKDPSGQGLGKEEAYANPGRGPSRHGGRASEQDSGAQAAGSMDKVGRYPTVQGHLDKHHTGRFPDWTGGLTTSAGNRGSGVLTNYRVTKAP